MVFYNEYHILHRRSVLDLTYEIVKDYFYNVKITALKISLMKI